MKRIRLTESESFLKKEKATNPAENCGLNDYNLCFVPSVSYPRDSRKSLQSDIGCPESPVIQNFNALSS